MRGSLVAQPALPLSAQALMREVETRLPGLGFMMIPVGLVAGHPEKQAVTPKVMSAALSPCASPAAFLLAIGSSASRSRRRPPSHADPHTRMSPSPFSRPLSTATDSF